MLGLADGDVELAFGEGLCGRGERRECGALPGGRGDSDQSLNNMSW
jgi:hypothetical protein